jgi:threonine aldolase
VSKTGLVDLSTDALTLPTPAMWDAMRNAEVGMASAGADESVLALERIAAAKTGKESAIFVPTGRMGNLLALLVHGRPGDQMLLDESSHVMCCEDASFAAIASLQARPVRSVDGALDPDDVERQITRRHYRHTPRTGLVVLENSFDAAGGTVITGEHMSAVSETAHRYDVPVHVDGSRIFNAACALGVSVADLAAPVDSVVFSLAKGLGAPFGALLCGSAAMTERARSHQRTIGAGSIHKLGIAAAAGIVALDTMVDRLADDHRRAGRLATALARLDGLYVDPGRVRTNIVMVDVSPSGATTDLVEPELRRRGVLCHPRDAVSIRLVTHRHIDDDDVDRATSAFRDSLHAVARPGGPATLRDA